ncbi:MAG: NADH-quinone oxidoreductase subunit E [Solirubrobacterales bacterium]|nr:MAG: NADH-quinone oxidoreductase subunit E [Solirubrobacterales bacterium]
MSTPASNVPRFAHGSRVPGWDEPVDLDKDPVGVPDPATTPVPEQLRRTIEDAMARYPDRHSASIPALWAAQLTYGWCSPEAIDQVACVMRITPAYLVAVATFYDMFEQQPVGRQQIYVCTNISCSLCGADELHAAICEAAGEDPDFNVRAFECLGACDIAPMVSVNGDYLGPLQPADAQRLVDDLRAGRTPLPQKWLRNRPYAGAAASAGNGIDREGGPRQSPSAGPERSSEAQGSGAGEGPEQPSAGADSPTEAAREDPDGGGTS